MLRFPDGTVKIMYPNGEEKSVYADGTVHFIDSKGKWKTIYSDGKEENEE